MAKNKLLWVETNARSAIFLIYEQEQKLQNDKMRSHALNFCYGKQK